MARLEDLVRALAEASSAAVESFLGLAATASVGGQSFTAAVVADGTVQDQVRTSVRVPLGLSGSVVLLAGVPGALVDLAADLAHTLGTAPGSVVLDEDLVLPDTGVAHRALDDLTVLNQAVGVLVARGRTVVGAHAELVARSVVVGGSPADAARVVLGSLRPGAGRRGSPRDDAAGTAGPGSS